MRTLLVVMDHGFRNQQIEMLHPKGDEVIEAFLLQSLNEPPDEGLGVGSDENTDVYNQRTATIHSLDQDTRYKRA